jgi:hypothetical protein
MHNSIVCALHKAHQHTAASMTVPRSTIHHIPQHTYHGQGGPQRKEHKHIWINELVQHLANTMPNHYFSADDIIIYPTNTNMDVPHKKMHA